jgi:hypothetical protein
MIPKRASFYWEGEPMSWLRRQSVDSFRALNPGWDVQIIDGNGLPMSPDSKLSIVHRSDAARYKDIFDNGGFYFDTDIVFTSPVPDEWLRHRVVMGLNHVAILGGVPGEYWYSLLYAGCIDLHRTGRCVGYQGYGVTLVNKLRGNLAGKDVFWLDDDAVLPVMCNETDRLWNEWTAPISARTFGVHWYGGDLLAQRMERVADEKWMEDSRCLVAQALRHVRANA